MKTIRVPKADLINELLRQNVVGNNANWNNLNVVSYDPKDPSKVARLDWQKPAYQGWKSIPSDSFLDHNGNDFTWDEEGENAIDESAAALFIETNLLDEINVEYGDGSSESFRVEYI